MTFMPASIEQQLIAFHRGPLGQTVLYVMQENLRDGDLETTYYSRNGINDWDLERIVEFPE